MLEAGAPMLSDLAVTPFAEILRRLSVEQRSGDLQVRAGKVAKTVFFDHGRVVFAASNLKKERLGESLIAAGRITTEQFQQASSLMGGDRRRRFGEALVQAGLLDQDEVGRVVARQVKRITLSLFELADGAAAFEDRACGIPLEYMVSVSVHRLLYMGIKSMSSETLILSGLGDLDRWVRLAALPPFRFGVRKCSAEEKEILDLARRRVTLRRLAWQPGGLGFARLRAAYALLASGVLEDAERPAAEQPVVQMETTTFLLSALQRQPDPSGREAIRREVDEELARSANLDREKWLRVSRSAPRDVLVRALEEKMERYHALLEAVAGEPRLKTDIELILGRASGALRLARQAPEEPLTAQEAQEVAPPSEAAAASVAAAPAQPVPAQPPREAAEPPAPPAAAAPHASAGVLASSAQVEHLIMEGSVRMTVSDYANAVNVYGRLVELEPDVPAHRVRLAVAMTHHPPTQKAAERQFQEALRLEPNNAEIHYQLACYYRVMRVRSRALAELRAAVSLNPRHKKAREELEAVSPKDSVLTSLKKMFR